VTAVLDQTRREWREGHRRFEAEVRESARGEVLIAELDAVTAELRRRVGQHFTLGELVSLYADSDRWTREAVAEIDPAGGWPARLSLVGDAAFHLYSRGAIDYEP
jgi:hypothetical protein